MTKFKKIIKKNVIINNKLINFLLLDAYYWIFFKWINVCVFSSSKKNQLRRGFIHEGGHYKWGKDQKYNKSYNIIWQTIQIVIAKI